MSNTKLLAQSPLTDPRSLLSSAAFHGLLLFLGSFVVLARVFPGDDTTRSPSVIVGALDPVDNRTVAVQPGGGPGEIGGTLTPEEMERLGGAGTPVASDALAESLIEDILPVPMAASSSTEPLPLPDAPGLGVLPGPGLGGGGGSGGGSDGGQGPGIGAGTEFFGTKERAQSFLYVIDRSHSMNNRGAINLAKRELLASLEQLPPEADFGVLFYNEKIIGFPDPTGVTSLMSATLNNKGRLERTLQEIVADGATNHVDALLAGIDLKPEVIFFLTDADRMQDWEAEKLIRAAGPIRIQAIEFGLGPDLGVVVPLRTLATSTGGSYRYVDLTLFSRGRFSNH